MPNRQFMDITGPAQRRTHSYLRPSPGRALSPLAQTTPSVATQPVISKPVPAPLNQVFSTPAPDRARPSNVQAVTIPRQNKSAVLKRQSVHKSAVAIHKVTHPKKRFKKEHALVIASFVMFVAGAGMAFSGWQYRKSNSSVAGVSTVKPDPDTEGIYIGGALVENDPTTSQYRNYVTDGDHPRYIRIPNMNVNSRVRQVGLDQASRLQLTTSIFDAGWYKRSASPGSVGVTLIAGHSVGSTRGGIFRNIQDLKAGNLMVVERGNGTRVQYKILSTKPFSRFSLDELMVPLEAGKSELHLVTYPTLPVTSDLAQPGVIVYAVQI